MGEALTIKSLNLVKVVKRKKTQVVKKIRTNPKTSKGIITKVEVDGRNLTCNVLSVRDTAIMPMNVD